MLADTEGLNGFKSDTEAFLPYPDSDVSPETLEPLIGLIKIPIEPFAEPVSSVTLCILPLTL